VTSGNTAAISGAGLAMGAVLAVHAGADQAAHTPLASPRHA